MGGQAPIDVFDRFVFDLDGTVWLSGRPLPHVPEVLTELRRRGKVVIFMTNSPSRSSQEVAADLRSVGIEAHDGEVVTAGRAAREYLLAHRVTDCAAFLIGDRGLRDDLEQQLSLEIIDPDDLQRAEHTRLVVVGRDEDLSYAKLRTAFRAIRAGALFLATNRDRIYPVADGVWPGGGAIVRALEYSTGVTATAVGKPEPPMLDAIAVVLRSGGPILVVGDKPDADVACARHMGCAAALVMTGATKPGDPIQPEPDFIFDDVSALMAPPI